MTRYRRYGRYDVDEDEALENGILKDGYAVSVPLMMRDGLTPLQRSVAEHSLAMRLHDGHGGAVGHKPGFVYSTDASLNDAREAAYRAYDAEQRDAYKHLQGWRADIDASDEARDATTVMDEREAAYRARDEADANAWRGPRSSGKWPIGSEQ
jgi:hypothetical protein